LKGCVKELCFDNVVDLCYLIPSLDLKSSFRRGKSDIESIDMVACVRPRKAFIVYIIHRVDEPTLTPHALPTPYMPILSKPKSMAFGSIQ